MACDKDRKCEKDDFWDLSSIIAPSKKAYRPSSKSISTVEISDGAHAPAEESTRLTGSSTLIKRYIPPHSPTEDGAGMREVCTYVPENSLLHKVTLYKAEGIYGFYEEFCKTARRMWNRSGEPCAYVDYFSYSPQYNQLSREQLAYYLWWRDNIRKRVYIATNSCYISLYIYELINTDGMMAPREARDSMIEVIRNYTDVLRGTVSRYLKWICDYSIIHHLAPPENMGVELLKHASTLKEYFVRVPGDTPSGWADTLLRYCCSYDYHTSKFAVGDALTLYDTHVRMALADCVRYLSGDGRILSGLPFDDCKLTSKAYEGAVCSSENRYIIQVEYCSFSRSHELRFLVGDIVKYCENKIRAHISVKSRLTVFSVSNDLRDIIDKYFAEALPPSSRPRHKAQERHEYDALYDLPCKGLDLTAAARIELESWDTTKELVSTFLEDTATVPVPDAPVKVPESSPISVTEADSNKTDELGSALGIYYSAVKSLANGDSLLLRELARKMNMPLDAVIDSINETAVDIIGDILIDGDDGGYEVIDDYKELIV